MTLPGSQKKVSVERTNIYQGHRDAIFTLAPGFSTNSFLSAGSEGIVAEWSQHSSDANALAQTHAPVYSIASLISQNKMILGLRDGSLLIVDPQTKTTLKSIQAHSKGIFDILILPGNEKMVTSGEDGHLMLWSLEDFSLEKKIRLSDKSVRTLCLSVDGRIVYAGSSDNHIYKLNTNLEAVSRWESHFLSVFRIKLHPDSGNLISIGRDAHIREWDLAEETPREINAVPAHMYAINDLVFHPTKPFFFTASMDKSIKVWDSRNLELVKVIDYQRYECHKNGVNRLLFANGSLYSCGDDRLIMEWKINFSDPN